MTNNPLSNAAYTEKYRMQRYEYEALFAEENKVGTEEIMLSDGYRITTVSYRANINSLNIDGQTGRLYNSTNELIHSWKNLDNDADFQTIVNHQNGNTYLVYREDLYGYSVFDITNKRDFQYYPQCVLDGREYFIWTDVHYNSTNNLLAVTGCIWGAPWSTLIVDFANPIAEPQFQMDVIDCLDGSYDTYDDADFVRWDGYDLVLSCYNIAKETKEEIALSAEVYSKNIIR